MNPTRPSPRILIVEDDPDQRELVAEALAEHWPDAAITCLGSGAEAAEVNAADHDIALLDFNLPDCCGLEILARLLQQDPDLPAIMVTGERLGRNAIDSIQAGASDYILKHGDYLMVLPPVIQKNLAMAEIKAQNRKLQLEIEQRNAELADKNAELAQRNDQLREMAVRDPLTGLYNRRHFSDVLSAMFAEAERYGNDLACVMIDLDNFKRINDSLGHQAGDRLLIAASRAIRHGVRTADVVARYGGDEFVVLMPQSSAAEVAAMAERIGEDFTRLVADELPDVDGVTMSFGVAGRLTHHPHTGDDLVKLADRALYDAKARGKNTIAVGPA